MGLEIIHHPHPTLRFKSQSLKKVDAELREMIVEMFALMYKYEGVGLAANQVNLPYRFFVSNPTGDIKQPEHEQVYINPVLSGGKGTVEGEEGCLSLPGVFGIVKRYQSIKVEAYDLTGQAIKKEVRGFEARVLQHEVDHLDGVMFIDRLSETQIAEVEETVSEFEIAFKSQIESGEAPTDEQVEKRTIELLALRCL